MSQYSVELDKAVKVISDAYASGRIGSYDDRALICAELRKVSEPINKSVVGPITVEVNARDLAQHLQDGTRPIMEILGERQDQDRKWGGAENDDKKMRTDWLNLIDTHMSKAYSEGVKPGDDKEWRRQLVKMGGLIVAALQADDRLRERAESDAAAVMAAKEQSHGEG